jgi:hypothetical protein
MVDNKKYLEDFFNKAYFNQTMGEAEFYINAMIINNSTLNYTLTDRTVPAFSMDQATYDLVGKYNIENEKDNTFAFLYYIIFDIESNSFVALILSLSIAGVLLITVFTWYLQTRRNSQHVGSVQKAFTIYMVLKLLLCLLIIYYVKICMENSSFDNIGDALLKIYIETIVSTIQSVLKTVLWFIIILVSFVQYVLIYRDIRSIEVRLQEMN